MVKHVGNVEGSGTSDSREQWKKQGLLVRTRNGGDVEELDKVILRSDGTSTYIAKDIPYAVWKTGLVSDPFSYRKFAEQWDGSILWSSTK